MFVLEAILLLQLASGERAGHVAGARDATRRIIVALDRELTSMQALMTVLATSDHLKAGHTEAFINRAMAVRRPDGSAIVLRNRQGKVLGSTGHSRNGTPPTAPDDSARADPEVASTPFSGLLLTTSGSPMFSVAASAPGHADIDAYSISLEVPVAYLGEIVSAAEIPSGMVASLTDRAGYILARTRDAYRLVGTRVSPDFRIPYGETQGWRTGISATGESIVLGFSRSSLSGWTATVFMPEAEFAQPLRRSLWQMLGIAGLLAAVVTALASWSARRIVRPINALASFASSGRRVVHQSPHGRVREVDAVATALADARADAMARLAEREDLLLVLDRAQVLVRAPDGRISMWTSGSERLYGWTRAQALGRISHELLQTRFPESLDRIMTILMERGEWQGDLVQRRRDGSLVTVVSHWALRRGRDGEPTAIVEASNDITGLREAEAALRLNRDLLASVLNASAEPISARDLDGRYVLLNRPAAVLLGTTVEAALGHTTRELSVALADATDRDEHDVIATGETRVIESELLSPSGDLRVIVSSKAPWRDGTGRIVGVVTVARDITMRRQAQARLQKKQEELIHVSRLSAMGAVAAELAHELNQPLTAVANFADAARRILGDAGVPDAEQLGAAREAMSDAAAQAVHAGAIIRRLREFIGRGDSDRQPTDLNDLVEETARLAIVGAEKQDVQMCLDLDPHRPRVVADRVQIQQVVFNLVRNALEAMQDQPTRILRIQTAVTDQDSVTLTVSDTGHGIRPEMEGHLFEPFVGTKAEGMGIGLSICRTIVEEHGGQIAVRARADGSSFEVGLPGIAARTAATTETVIGR